MQTTNPTRGGNSGAVASEAVGGARFRLVPGGAYCSLCGLAFGRKEEFDFELHVEVRHPGNRAFFAYEEARP